MIKELYGNSYPGRGIIIGNSESGRYAVTAYFIMGRSVNSRNRVFTVSGEGIKTEALDPSKLSDPSLIIYSPVRVIGDSTIVTNGDQTDTVYDFLSDGKTFEEALRTREYEPDEPNFTPRISGILTTENKSFSYKLSILKNKDGICQRNFYEYEAPVAGKGHLIHTYNGDGNPIPSYTGEPKTVCIPDDIESFTNELWDSLDSENKVSLFVRYIDLETGKYETRIVNKGE